MPDGTIWPAPKPSPIAIAKNKYINSSGSLMGVLKRTIDNAPTNPKDSAKDDLTINITKKTIKDRTGNVLAIWKVFESDVAFSI